MSHSPVLLWLQKAQAAIDDLPADNYGLYELLHREAACIAAVDSCYFCFYRPQDDALFFVYNFDRELHDEPLTVEIGNGPTSWVVRHKRPFVLGADNDPTHAANLRFGDDDRLSSSAIHLPVAIREHGVVPGDILGVFSIQSYQPGAYNQEIVLALQLLCDHAALHIQRHAERLDCQQKLEAVADKARDHEAHKIRMANHVLELLRPLTQGAQTLAHRLSRDAAPSLSELRGQSLELSRMCHRLQTQVSQLPIDNRALPAGVSPAASTRSDDNPLCALSDRELEVLQLISTGAANAQIALTLSCTIHTAKKHCANIYHKLGVKNRTGATQIYHRYAGSAKIIL